MASSSGTIKSEVKTRANGEQFVPASVRPDGSVRKEIRVKKGYKSPDEVEVYRNRTAAAWKDRRKGGVPGAEPARAPEPKSATTRRKRPNKAQIAEPEGTEGWETKVNGEAGAGQKGEENQAKAVDPEESKAKEARKLAKKLRQAQELSEKKQNGEKLLPEQYQKVLNMSELSGQLEKLGFNTEGERQTEAAATN
ncbi:hypothetical protein MBLNU230_g0861t1 [Neophaeotheca triangularis]